MYVLTDVDASIFSDLYKDAYGFRPRGEFKFNDEAEARAEFAKMQRYVDESIQREREQQNRALMIVLDRIQNLARQFSITRATALRWLMQAHDTHDLGEFAYVNGLALDYTAERALREFTFRK